ncbi:hypothetical protein PI95_033100 [Hassallia byssoidea VB512170]|uniref:Uncharacterized protein n=1 Tax=Hassallia byssoidea VB512170 TaxID=1304833 RepID=A0A846HJS7_9CYAN|nr:hypothetical protein [Hassalia byssoidea]NEU77203.1 hypothetical protein [Hassalia byssoidea VB512170]
MDLKASSTTSVVKPKVYFYFVDALRGIAALWVILFHAPLDRCLDLLTSVLPDWFVMEQYFSWGLSCLTDYPLPITYYQLHLCVLPT